MAEAPYPINMRESDKPAFRAWLEECRALGVADKMTDALRLAVRLAAQASADEIRSGELRNQ